MNENDVIRERQRIISKLTEARLEKRLSQQELADLIGTKRSNICRMESGAQNITLDYMIRVAAALGKDLSVILETQKKAETERYVLKLYDEVLLTFTLTDGGLEGLRAEIVSVNEGRREVFPLDLELTGDGILKWLRKRVIPKNRAFVEEILKTLGLSLNHTKEIIDVCRGLSLNDSYWVVPESFEGSFSAYNLYENPFSNALAIVAYTGVGHGRRAVTTTPELTTQGMLRKAWRMVEGDGIYLYKGGASGAVNAGMEPYSEYYACQIAEKMGLNAVHYDLEYWKGILASKCRLFTDIDTSYVPIGRIVKDGGLKACLEYFETVSPEAAEDVRSMLVFDAVIYNEDRHFGNFGVLRDNHTGRVLAAAPVFDHGLSLFNYATEDDIRHLEEYAKTRTTPYGISFEDVCREVMGTKQRAELRRLLEFRFTRHPSINLPEERLAAIEAQIGRRVRTLLALPRR